MTNILTFRPPLVLLFWLNFFSIFGQIMNYITISLMVDIDCEFTYLLFPRVCNLIEMPTIADNFNITLTILPYWFNSMSACYICLFMLLLDSTFLVAVPVGLCLLQWVINKIKIRTRNLLIRIQTLLHRSLHLLSQITGMRNMKKFGKRCWKLSEPIAGAYHAITMTLCQRSSHDFY